VINEEKLCPGLAKIEIVRTSDSFSIAKQQIEFNQFYFAYYDFCVGKSVFDSLASLPITVRCEALDGTILCEYPATIDSCTMPTLCTPDYLNTKWIPNGQPNTLSIGCESDTISNCHVIITYSYRAVMSGPNVLFRDIEVTSFDFDPACSGSGCQNELVKQILDSIWNQKKVIDEFKFSPSSWGSDTIRCFDNMRVISSDCWQYYQLPDGGIATKQCDSNTCCYGIYHTCYKRVRGDTLIYLPDSTAYTQFDNVPVECKSGCESGNCQKMLPCMPTEAGPRPCPPCCQNGGPHGGGKIIFNEGDVKDNICKVKLISDSKNSSSIDLTCELNGRLNLEIFDLLGQIIFSKYDDKTTYKMNIPIENRLNTGLYLVWISLDGDLIYYNKLNIIK